MRSRWCWPGVAIGSVVIVFGLVGAFTHSGSTRPIQLLAWTVGAAAVHDAFLAPLVVALGLVTARWVPVVVRVPVRVALVLSGLVTALAWPYVRGYGYRASNPSALPLHYGRNLLIVLAAIWSSVAAVTISRRLAAKRSA
jgi:hypothetical protein